ncbi:MAG: ankyrin repeat domain-containing protein [Betaproteobacteria bacterium]
MAVQINPRTAIIAGAGALVVAGAAAWFFLFQDEPPPPKPAAKAPAAAAKAAAKAEAPAKPAAGAPQSVVAKPAAGKPTPIPTDPDKLVAEIIELSGMRGYFQTFGRETMLASNVQGQGQQAGMGPAEVRQMLDMVERVFPVDKMAEEFANNVKAAFDTVKMGRFLELMREPVVRKLHAAETRNLTPEVIRQYMENFRKEPPSAARQKLVQTIDEITSTSEIGGDMALVIARDTLDAMFEAMQKLGKPVSRDERQAAGSILNASQGQMRSTIRTALHMRLREASDDELAEYVKIMDTEAGRWGMEVLANALRPVMESRAKSFGRELAQVAMATVQSAAKAAAAAPAIPEQKEPPKAAPVAATAPVEAPGYQRPAGIRQLYSRYNDLVSAVVMRDTAAVKELLADGKSPDVRQSDGFTPLMIAVANGDTAIAQALLAARADPNLRAPGGQSALALAKARNNTELLQLLERSGARN